MLQPMHLVEERTTPYPTVTDFLRSFNEEMHSLYLLSFLLTADYDKAEKCLVSATGECVEGSGAKTRDPDDQACTGARGLRIAHQSREIGYARRKQPL